jgi:hypothetical protein
MPFKNKDQKRRYDRERIARLRAAEHERLAADAMAAWREMAANPEPFADQFMSADQVRSWARYVLTLPELDLSKLPDARDLVR